MKLTRAQIYKLLTTFDSVKLDGVTMVDWEGPEQFGWDGAEDEFHPVDTVLSVYDEAPIENANPINEWCLEEMLESEITDDRLGLRIGNIELRFFSSVPMFIAPTATETLGPVAMAEYNYAVELLRRLLAGNYPDSIWADVKEVVEENDKAYAPKPHAQ